MNICIYWIIALIVEQHFSVITSGTHHTIHIEQCFVMRHTLWGVLRTMLHVDLILFPIDAEHAFCINNATNDLPSAVLLDIQESV